MHLLNLLFIFVTLLHRSVGFYDSKSAVTDENEKRFSQEVKGYDVVVLVDFYLPWCVYCKNLQVLNYVGYTSSVLSRHVFDFVCACLDNISDL